MSKLRDLALGVWEFVVGDDWRTALGVAAAIALTALIAETTVATWWIMPVAVLLLLILSVWRSMRAVFRREDV